MEFNAYNPAVAGEFARMIQQGDAQRGLTRKFRRACTNGARPATVFVVEPQLIAPCLHAASESTHNAISIYLLVAQEQLYDNLSDECATIKALVELKCFRPASNFWKMSRRQHFAFWEGLMFTPDTLEALIQKVGVKEVAHYLAFYAENLYERLDELNKNVTATWSMSGEAPTNQVDFATNILALADTHHLLWEDAKDTYLRSKESWLAKTKG